MGIFDSLAGSLNDGLKTVTNEFLPAGLKNVEGKIRKVQKLAENVTSSKGFAKAGRAVHLPPGASGPIKASATANFPKSQEQDWRVRLSIPDVEPFKTESELLGPLRDTNNSLVFPFTPSVIVSHSASYNALQPTHTNYPYQIYQSSQVDQLVITGDFFVQNGIEAQYWVAALHYLRSCTKMFYGGEGTNQGAPPPVVKLNGYGDYVFNDVPVVIQQFTVDMPQEVDYISTSIGEYTGGVMGPMIPKPVSLAQAAADGSRNSLGQQTGGGARQGFAPTEVHPKVTTTPQDPRNTKVSWAPAQSLFSVTVQPIYSRTAVESFSLEKFVNGGYVGNNTGGFI